MNCRPVADFFSVSKFNSSAETFQFSSTKQSIGIEFDASVSQPNTIPSRLSFEADTVKNKIKIVIYAISRDQKLNYKKNNSQNIFK